MDFNAFVGSLRRGAVVLIDDINWDDRRWSTGPTRTHEGWLEVVSHPRVKRAVEIDQELADFSQRQGGVQRVAKH